MIFGFSCRAVFAVAATLIVFAVACRGAQAGVSEENAVLSAAREKTSLSEVQALESHALMDARELR